MLKPFCVILFSILCSSALSQVTDGDDGYTAFSGYFPWVAYIEVLEDESLTVQSDCLGALISPAWVFATARCSISSDNTYRLSFGSANTTQSQISMISRNFLSHPDFDVWDSLHLNNAGLIQLPLSITFSDTISAITLPWHLADDNLAGREAYFVGRRLIQDSSSGNFHPIIRWNMLNIITDQACDNLSSNDRYDTEMCAVGTATNPTKTPCRSLGFLVIHTNMRFVLVSGSGNDDCSLTIPNKFPRATLFLDWITSVTGITSDQ